MLFWRCSQLVFTATYYLFYSLVHYFWRPIVWILVFGPASFVLFKSLIEGLPIRGCIKNPMNRPLNHIFLMLKWCTAAKIQYYSSVSRLQSLHFPLWSDLEIFSLSSGFCSDASNDFSHTFAIITASEAPIARPSDCTYQIPLHLKWTFVTERFSKLFMADLGISGARLLE